MSVFNGSVQLCRPYFYFAFIYGVDLIKYVPLFTVFVHRQYSLSDSHSSAYCFFALSDSFDLSAGFVIISVFLVFLIEERYDKPALFAARSCV